MTSRAIEINQGRIGDSRGIGMIPRGEKVATRLSGQVQQWRGGQLSLSVDHRNLCPREENVLQFSYILHTGEGNSQRGTLPDDFIPPPPHVISACGDVNDVTW